MEMTPLDTSKLPLLSLPVSHNLVQGLVFYAHYSKLCDLIYFIILLNPLYANVVQSFYALGFLNLHIIDINFFKLSL